MTKPKNIQKLLAANRSEIAIRIFRAANELGLRTVGIYSQEDRLGLHRFKADEAYQVGAGKGPVEAYLDIAGIVALAKAKSVDAIHPGYGFLSENPVFAREIGYPVIVKASIGGGGRGMRVVHDAAQLEAKLEEAQGEARSAFDDASVFLEKYLPRAKHLEVQILGDQH